MKKTNLRKLKLNKKTVTTLNQLNTAQINGGIMQKYPTTVFCTRTCETYSCGCQSTNIC